MSRSDRWPTGHRPLTVDPAHLLRVASNRPVTAPRYASPLRPFGLSDVMAHLAAPFNFRPSTKDGRDSCMVHFLYF